METIINAIPKATPAVAILTTGFAQDVGEEDAEPTGPLLILFAILRVILIEAERYLLLQHE